MSRANIGWLFYKEMYKKGNNDTHIKNTMSRLLEVSAKDESMSSKQSFRMETTYPGLVIGSGYAHGLSSDFDAKIGFYFDHTTGLPLIQGSSVKGLLRSCFGLPIKGQADKYEEKKHKFINSLLNKEVDVKALGNEIFEGLDAKGEPMSIYKRDIFYEARVVNVKDKLLHDDYITPHKEPLKNPTPIRFIKVAPEVTFEFSFDLKDSEALDVTADDKEMLFLKLLQEFGIGAKSNVGYGQFKEWSEDEFLDLERKQKRRAKEEEKRGLEGFELFIKELESIKLDQKMVKKIKEYKGEIEDIDKIREIINTKSGADKFRNRIIKYLDTL